MKSIEQTHRRDNHWEDVGYNFVVTADGTICEARNGSWAAARRGEVIHGAHAGDSVHNQRSFGVALDGDFTDVTSFDQLPVRQRTGTLALLAALCHWAGLVPPHALVSHRAVRCPRPTACPGGLAQHDVLLDIGARVAAAMGAGPLVPLQLPANGMPPGFEPRELGGRVVGARWSVDGHQLDLPIPVEGRAPAGVLPVAMTLPLLGDLATIELTGIGSSPAIALSGRILEGRRLPIAPRVDGDSIVIPLEGHLDRFDLDGGRVRVEALGCHLELRLTPVAGGIRTALAMRPSDAGTTASLVLGVDLAIRRALSEGRGSWSAEHAPSTWVEPVPLLAQNGAVPSLVIRHVVQEEADLLVSFLPASGVDWRARAEIVPATVVARSSVETTGPMTIPALVGRIFDAARSAPNLRFDPDAAMRIDEGRLSVGPVRLDFGHGIELSGHLRLEPDLTVPSSAAALTFTATAGGAVDAPGDALTLVIHSGTRWECRFADAGPELVSIGRRIATALAPAVPAEVARRCVDDPDIEIAPGHFVLRVNDEVRIAADGVFFRASLEPRAMEIGNLERAASVDGELRVVGSMWVLDARAEFGLPWFDDARGTLRFSAGRDSEIRALATFSATLATVWTDPSGVLAVHEPRVSATVAVSRSGFGVTGAVSGRLELRTGQLVGAAEAWGRELFAGITLDFDAISFDELKALVAADAGSERFPVKLRLRDGLRCDLWEILPFRLTALKLGVGRRIRFEGEVAFHTGPVVVGGRLPGLDFRLARDRIELDLGSGEGMKLWTTLQLPSGLRAQAVLSIVDEAREQSLLGSGVVSVPGLGQVEIAFVLGRHLLASGGWTPTIAMYVDGPVVVTVYPGVVLKRVGLGFGVHRTLRGTRDRQDKPVSELYAMLAAEAAPDPSRPEDWVVDLDTPVQLVVRALATATTSGGSVVDYYVAELLIAIDSQLRTHAFNEIWLLSRQDDVRGPAATLRGRPFARGILVADVAAPSLRAAWRTLPDGRSSLAQDPRVARGLQTFVAGGATSIRLEAVPHRFEIVVGPRQLSERVGPLRIDASSTLAVRADRRGVIVAAGIDVFGEVSGGVGVSSGPAAISLVASAGLRASVGMLGGFAGSTNLVVFGTASVEAWFSLDVHVRIGFSKTIKFSKFFRVHISWHEDFRVGLGVSARVEIECALSTERGAALRARARLGFQVLGFNVGVDLPAVGGGDDDLIEDARTVYKMARAGSVPPASERS